MDAGGLGFLVAGSRREFVVLNVDDFSKVKPPDVEPVNLYFPPFWLLSSLNGLWDGANFEC
jgi:hypothetical protein